MQSKEWTKFNIYVTIFFGTKHYARFTVILGSENMSKIQELVDSWLGNDTSKRVVVRVSYLYGGQPPKEILSLGKDLELLARDGLLDGDLINQNGGQPLRDALHNQIDVDPRVKAVPEILSDDEVVVRITVIGTVKPRYMDQKKVVERFLTLCRGTKDDPFYSKIIPANSSLSILHGDESFGLTGAAAEDLPEAQFVDDEVVTQMNG